MRRLGAQNQAQETDEPAPSGVLETTPEGFEIYHFASVRAVYPRHSDPALWSCVAHLRAGYGPRQGTLEQAVERIKEGIARALEVKAQKEANPERPLVEIPEYHPEP
jgi:hypothetical protein